MASSNMKNPTSHDVSTDTDDSDCAKGGSDSTNNDIASNTKHRGYEGNNSNIMIDSFRLERNELIIK